MADAKWQDLGPAEAFQRSDLTEASLGRQKLAVSCKDGKLGVIAGTCNHVGGPLGKGRLDGEYVVCPWHNWKFHRSTGKGEPGFEEDCVPAYEAKVEKGRLLVRTDNPSARNRKPHAPHPLARKIERAPGAIRVAGISTTNMDEANPRYSTSDALLEVALGHAKGALKILTVAGGTAAGPRGLKDIENSLISGICNPIFATARRGGSDQPPHKGA